MWPAAEPGVYEGEWRPSAAGDYALDVSVGAARAAALAHVDAGIEHGAGQAAERITLIAAASGGRVVADEQALVDALRAALPPRTVSHPSRPGRSPWWAALFAVVLCTEWMLRRRRGAA